MGRVCAKGTCKKGRAVTAAVKDNTSQKVLLHPFRVILLALAKAHTGFTVISRALLVIGCEFIPTAILLQAALQHTTWVDSCHYFPSKRNHYYMIATSTRALLSCWCRNHHPHPLSPPGPNTSTSISVASSPSLSAVNGSSSQCGRLSRLNSREKRPG